VYYIIYTNAPIDEKDKSSGLQPEECQIVPGLEHKYWIGCIWASFLDERTHKSLLSEQGYRDITVVLLVF